MDETTNRRVFALRNSDDERVYSYGMGTYVGDLPCPDKIKMLGGEDEIRGQLQRIIEEGDQTPIEESFVVQLFDGLGPGETIKTREDAIAHEQADRARSMDERVQERFEITVNNPCIHLDSGDIVWGMQCWWGPEEKLESKTQGREVVIVPVPEGNGRWTE